MSYKKAITAFEALPEEEKYLIRNRYTRGGRHCAMGLLVQVPDLERRNAVGIWDLTNFNNETYDRGARSDARRGSEPPEFRGWPLWCG